MAIEHGQYGHYPALKRRRHLLFHIFLTMGCMVLIGFVLGITLRGWVLPAAAGWGELVYSLGGCLVLAVVGGLSLRWISRNEPQFFKYVKGADGEAATAEVLQRLPNAFHVLHGINVGHGDIDHLVIGPTGVFALDSKKWTGHYEVDAQSRLVRNGYPMPEKHAEKLQRRLMDVRSAILAPGGSEHYFQGAMVFVNSNVKHPSPSIGRIDVIPLDNLVQYITRTQGRRGLTTDEIELLALRAKGFVAT